MSDGVMLTELPESVADQIRDCLDEATQIVERVQHLAARWRELETTVFTIVNDHRDDSPLYRMVSESSGLHDLSRVMWRIDDLVSDDPVDHEDTLTSVIVREARENVGLPALSL